MKKRTSNRAVTAKDVADAIRTLVRIKRQQNPHLRDVPRVSEMTDEEWARTLMRAFEKRWAKTFRWPRLPYEPPKAGR